jgi:hypothetical protein
VCVAIIHISISSGRANGEESLKNFFYDDKEKRDVKLLQVEAKEE